ncbi:MAG TPA: efflux RND transporter permease subunit [Xanthomonadales bacterium]|nr:efflux RND transporter permease subunit [Xanthomonadales bacterium]
MIAWFARNPVAANLLMISVVIGGLVAFNSALRLEAFPPFDIDTINVSVELRGASPEDIELGAAVRIEEAIKDIEGIDRIVSRSREGGTRVSVEVDADYDPLQVLDTVKSRVDAINTLPAEAEKPIVSLAERRFAVINVVISGNQAEEEVRRLGELVREELLMLDSVSFVELDSARRYEIAIEASADRLREYDLTLQEIAWAVRESSVDLSAGNVRTLGGDILIRSKGQAYRRGDFESIVVKTNPDGSIVRVVDVAEVMDGFEEDSISTRFNGMEAVFLDVSRTGNQSALDISREVKDYVQSRQANLPAGIELNYWDDDAQVLKNRLAILSKSALQGGALVILMLALFLRPAIAFWVFAGIPVAFLGAFILMTLFDISLNMMSAFGFIIVLGIVVDDAIVTGENVYKHMQIGDNSLDAAIDGTREVAIPVTFGILTTILAFVPLMFIDGFLGTWYAPVAMVAIPVLLFSLVESKLILPAHLAKVRPRSPAQSNSGFTAWQRRTADRFENFTKNRYQPFLDFTLRHRWSTLASFIGVLIVVMTLVASGWTRFVFFPSVESETATAELEMPVGTPFEVTSRHAERMFEAARVLQDKYSDEAGGEGMITNILSSIGASRRSTGPHLARIQFETAPREKRTSDLTVTELINEWREMVGSIPGAVNVSYRASWFRPGEPIDVQFMGNSLTELSSASDALKDRLESYPEVFDITDSLSDGKQEIQIELTPQGHLLGLTRSQVVQQVGQAFRGFEAQRIQRGRDDIRVLVRFPIEERGTISSLNEMLITTPEGGRIPLANVASLVPGKGPSEITRIDGYRVLNVTADVDKETTNMPVLQADLRQYLDGMLGRYPGITYQMEGEQRQQRDSFGSLMVGWPLLLFAIYVLLALPLKSYVQPLVVMSVIPFGIIGAVIGHWIMGYPLSFLSILGLLALSGVVVNDSLVLVDFINQKIRAGKSLAEAVRQAGVVRFRPVILTSVTTFFGLLPLLAEKASAAQILIPMAISLGFGILFATAVTLILVPANILILEDIRRFTSRFLPGTAYGGQSDQPESIS